MLKNYFKIAWRNIRKNKAFSIINIVGMAVGMVTVFIIAIWIQNEVNYDNFYSQNSDIYKLWNRSVGSGDVSTFDITSGPAAKALEQEYPEVKHAARIYWPIVRLLTYGDKQIKSTGNDVDPSFLEIFDFPLLSGNRKHTMDDENSIVLTESLARQLFGNEDPINKIITVDNKAPFKVTAVITDLPSNTDFDFNYLVPLTKAELYSNGWASNSYYTFVKLQAGVDVDSFNKKLRPLLPLHAPETNNELFLYPMAKMHLYSRFENGIPVGGKIETVRLVGLIGLLVLFIACINFISLSTARGQKRAKEVGVRKVIGASKRSLVRQFLTESIMLSFFAGMIALLMAILIVPYFNFIMDRPLEIHFSNPGLWIGLVLFILFTGAVSGIYPAFFLSAFKPIKTLKGMVSPKKSAINLRGVLVVLQFAIAIALIVSTLIIRRQIDYANQRNIGYNASNLIEIPAEGDVSKHYETLKAELLNSGAAKAVARTGWSVTVDGSSTGGNISWEGSTPEQESNFGLALVRAESDFISTLGLTLLEGRDVDFARLPGDSSAILLNDAAIKAMELEDPVGKTLKWGDKNLTIVGVFNDFIIGSPYSPISPMMVTTSKSWLLNIAIRMNEHTPIQQNLKKIEQVFKKFNPAYPFTYSFVDQEYTKKFKDQQQTGQLAFIFSGLAIFISCLGLFGLASYIAETRIKEIGIRKVLGASIGNITTMLSKDFLKLVLIAMIVASPVAWWLMSNWLNDFHYRISIQWWHFVVPGLIAAVIALFTVSFQAIKAAIANPVDSLRDE